MTAKDGDPGGSDREAFEALQASGAFDEVLAKLDAGDVQLTEEAASFRGWSKQC